MWMSYNFNAGRLQLWSGECGAGGNSRGDGRMGWEVTERAGTAREGAERYGNEEGEAREGD